MSDNQFKVGDMVRRTSQGSRGVTQGGVYEVTSVDTRYIYFLGETGLQHIAIGDYFELVTTDSNSKDTTAMTTSKFTETVTTTKTTVKEVTNGSLSNDACMSVARASRKGKVLVVVGARYEDRYCATFSKKPLQELINELQAVHDAMEESDGC
jgi:hypothetical protein